MDLQSSRRRRRYRMLLSRPALLPQKKIIKSHDVVVVVAVVVIFLLYQHVGVIFLNMAGSCPPNPRSGVVAFATTIAMAFPLPTTVVRTTRHSAGTLLTANSRPYRCQQQHKQQQARRPKYQENRLFAVWRSHDRPWQENGCSTNNNINGRRPRRLVRDNRFPSFCLFASSSSKSNHHDNPVVTDLGSRQQTSADILLQRSGTRMTMMSSRDNDGQLPRLAKNRSTTQQQPTHSNNKSPYHVLLVDDEESIRSAVGFYLRKCGYQVTTVSDAASALDLLLLHDGADQDDDEEEKKEPTTSIPPTTSTTTRRRPVHVVISDIRMPDDSPLDGLDLVRHIRNEDRTVALPVVLLTAKGQTQDRIQGYEAGADAYLAKPFDPEELVSIVDNLMVKHYESLSSLSYSQQQQKEQQPSSSPSGRSLPPESPSSSIYADRDEYDDQYAMDDDDDDDGTTVTVDKRTITELQRELNEIKQMLLEQGGGGLAVPGFVQQGTSSSSRSRQPASSSTTTTTLEDNDGGDRRVFFPPDEQQVLELLCQGQGNREIAEQTFRSTRRVEQLITRMFRKTQVSNRTALIRWALATGHVRL